MACLKALVLALLVMPVFAQPPHAQTPWRAPVGQFELVIPEGWQSIPPGEIGVGARSTADLFISPTPEAKALAEVGCSVFRLNHSAPAEVDQTAANAVLEDWDQALVASEASKGQSKPVEVTRFKNAVVDGVRTVSANYVVRSGSKGRIFMQSQFMLSIGGKQVAFFTLSCFVPESEKGADLSSASRAFESLRFGKPAGK